MLKILLIGSNGNMGRNHNRVLNKLTVHMEREYKTCDISGKADYADYKFAIKDFKPSHVVIAVPTPMHEELLDYCISEYIRNIFIEKPITDKYNTAVRYASVKDSNIMVGHVERFNPVVTYLKRRLKDKIINTIICTRSGMHKDTEDFNLHTDLCIHDMDICQLLLKKEETPNIAVNKMIRDRVANVFFTYEGVDCFLHADALSPFKRREIKVMCDDFIVEGDYIQQKVFENGKEIQIPKIEPLFEELECFIRGRYTDDERVIAIDNLKLLGV